MHPTHSRRFIFVVALIGLLFTLDAAFESALPPSYLLALVVLALGLAWLLVELSGFVLHGTHRQRQAAIIAFNAIGAVPPLSVFVMMDAADPRFVARVMAASIAWLAVVLLWTTLVLRHAAHRSAAVSPPAARGPTQPPILQPGPPWRRLNARRARVGSA